MVALAFGIFGLVIGSFLNVVILRHGEKSIGGRSACTRCGAQLAWYDMVPVFSWLALTGRCRTCRGTISVQYPLVEAGTGAAFALIGGSSLPFLSLPLGLAAASLLICIFVYDLRNMLIPDRWVWPAAVLSLLFALSLPWAIGDGALYPTLLSGPLCALPLLALWLGSGGRWMGFGDWKLALSVGWLLGYPLCVFGLLGAFVIGAIVSVCILLPLPYLLAACGIRPNDGGARYTMKSEVPFGPFLIASCFLLWLPALYGLTGPLLSIYGF